jgi:formate-dependent nitrite reductase membrane component NrfD
METRQRHGAQYSPEEVAASLARGDGGFGRNQETYFDLPVLRKSHWGWEIIVYFFVGGASAASAGLSLLADRPGGDPKLVRNGRYTALVGSALSSLLLVMDLGRPERFLNMLRIVKLKSPMSVGVYTLITFSSNAGLEVASQLRADGVLPFDPAGWIPRPLRIAVLGISSAYMATYTGVLLSATAIPVWFSGRRHIPAIFVLSAVTTGCALQSLLLALTGGDDRTIKRLETIELVSSLGEIAMLRDYERRAGDAAKPLFKGPRGDRLRTWTFGLGIAVPALLNLPSVLSGRPAHKPHRLRTIVASALALAGGYVLREAFIEAGRDSADDPRAYLRHPE